MKRKNIYIALLLGMFVLTSCKVGKSYVRPEMALPDSLAQQPDSMSIADEQWQAIYTDSTLRALIDRALEYNKDMLIAASRVKEMAAQNVSVLPTSCRNSPEKWRPSAKWRITAVIAVM